MKKNILKRVVLSLVVLILWCSRLFAMPQFDYPLFQSSSEIQSGWGKLVDISRFGELERWVFDSENTVTVVIAAIQKKTKGGPSQYTYVYQIDKVITFSKKLETFPIVPQPLTDG